MQVDLIVTERTKDSVWEGVLDTARYLHYYELLTNRWSLWDRTLKTFLLSGAILSVVATFAPWPNYVLYSSAFVVAFSTILDFVFNFGVRSARSHAASIECSIVQKEYDRLWNSIKAERITDIEAQARIENLRMRILAATASLSDTDRSLNRRAQNAANLIVANRYGIKWEENGNGRTS